MLASFSAWCEESNGLLANSNWLGTKNERGWMIMTKEKRVDRSRVVDASKT
jgi:hypothetical protein